MVFPAKYRRKVFSESVSATLREICLGIAARYEIQFIEIGMDEDHVHFLLQSVPTMSVSQIVTTIKSITAKHIFAQHPEVKKLLWGGKFWTSGYYANTVGQYASEEVIRKYVENQGKTYQKIHTGQLSLF
jgi:putative transposase